MVDPGERRRQRDDFLVALYELSDGHLGVAATNKEVAETALIPLDQVVETSVMLVREGFIESQMAGGLGNPVLFTDRGIRRAEELLLEREPQLDELDVRGHLEVVVRELRIALDADTTLEPEVRADVEADLEAASSQLRANRPNIEVIRGALLRIKALWPAVATFLGAAAALKALTGFP